MFKSVSLHCIYHRKGFLCNGGTKNVIIFIYPQNYYVILIVIVLGMPSLHPAPNPCIAFILTFCVCVFLFWVLVSAALLLVLRTTTSISSSCTIWFGVWYLFFHVKGCVLSWQGQAQEFWTLAFGLGTYFDNVLLDLGEPPCVLPLAVHLDLRHLPETQGYLGLLSVPCTHTQTLQKLWGGVDECGGWPIRF